jgi:hypothetical protein
VTTSGRVKLTDDGTGTPTCQEKMSMPLPEKPKQQGKKQNSLVPHTLHLIHTQKTGAPLVKVLAMRLIISLAQVKRKRACCHRLLPHPVGNHQRATPRYANPSMQPHERERSSGGLAARGVGEERGGGREYAGNQRLCSRLAFLEKG